MNYINIRSIITVLSSFYGYLYMEWVISLRGLGIHFCHLSLFLVWQRKQHTFNTGGGCSARLFPKPSETKTPEETMCHHHNQNGQKHFFFDPKEDYGRLWKNVASAVTNMVSWISCLTLAIRRIRMENGTSTWMALMASACSLSFSSACRLPIMYRACATQKTTTPPYHVLPLVLTAANRYQLHVWGVIQAREKRQNKTKRPLLWLFPMTFLPSPFLPCQLDIWIQWPLSIVWSEICGEPACPRGRNTWRSCSGLKSFHVLRKAFLLLKIQQAQGEG